MKKEKNVKLNDEIVLLWKVIEKLNKEIEKLNKEIKDLTNNSQNSLN